MLSRLALALILFGCKPQGQTSINTSSPQHTNLAALSKRIGVPLPESTRVIGVEHQQGKDDMIRAKLEMPRADLEAIGSALPIDPSKLRPGVGRLGIDRNFWNPSEYQDLRSGSVVLEGARGFHLGVAYLADGTAVVFIMSHGT